MSRVRVGVAGAGFWSRFQCAAWGEIEGGPELAAVCNPTLSKAQKLAEEFAIPTAVSTLEEMLASGGLDLIDLISPPWAHRQGVESCSQAGLPVICQKPMAETWEDCLAICEAKVPLWIHENFRFQKPILEAKKVIQSGVLGDLYRARVSFLQSFPVWENQPFLAKVERFILTDIGSHVLDIARSLFGEASSLLCRSARVNGFPGEDSATVLLEMSECPTVIVEMSYCGIRREDAFPQTFLFVEGSKGSLELHKGGLLKVTTREVQEDRVVEPDPYDWVDPDYAVVHSSIVACCQEIWDDFVHGKPSVNRGKENLKTMALVFGSYESAERDEMLRLTEDHLLP